MTRENTDVYKRQGQLFALAVPRRDDGGVGVRLPQTDLVNGEGQTGLLRRVKGEGEAGVVGLSLIHI